MKTWNSLFLVDHPISVWFFILVFMGNCWQACFRNLFWWYCFINNSWQDVNFIYMQIFMTTKFFFRIRFLESQDYNKREWYVIRFGEQGIICGWMCNNCYWHIYSLHYDDVIMGKMASQITSLTIVYSTIYSGADQRKHQSSASLAFVRRVPGEFHAQMASNAENVPIWWRHHGLYRMYCGSTK